MVVGMKTCGITVPSSDEEDDDSNDPIDIINALSASTVEPTTYKAVPAAI
jgi:hypothetical protein